MTSAIAFIMLAVFVVGLTVVDMLVLVFASARLSSKRGDSHGWGVAIAKKIKKLSMLDVCIMGVVIVVMALRNLRAKGVIISMRWGLVILLAAELCHYAAFHVVSRAASATTEIEVEKSTTG